MWMVRLCLWCAQCCVWCVHGCVVWAVRLALVAALGAGAAVWAAHRAPVTLPAIAVAGLEQALDKRAAQAGLSVALDGAEIALRGGLVPALSLRGVSLRAPDGVALMAADRAEVVFSRRSAAVGLVAPVAISVRGLGLRLGRDAEGRITLRLGQAALVEGAPDPAAALARLRAMLDSPALAGLRRVGLEDVTLDLRDAAEGRTIRAGGGTLRLDRTGRDLVLDMAMGMLGGADAGAGGVSIRIAVPGAGMAAGPDDADGPRAQLRVALRGVEPARLAGLAGLTPLGASLARIAAPVSLDLDGGLGPDGRALPLSGRLRVGTGRLRPTGDGAGIAMTGMGADLLLSADRRHLRLREMWLEAPAARVAGAADLRSDGAGGAITAQLALRDMALDVPRAGRAPLELRADRVWADLRVGGPGGAVEIAAMTLERGGARATGTGLFWPDGQIALDLAAGPLGMADARALWPTEIAPRARAWVAQTVSGGTIRDMRLSLRHDLRHPRAPGRVDDIAMSLQVDDGVMRVDPRLPPIAGLSGQVLLDRDRIAFLMDGGRIDLPLAGAEARPDGGTNGVGTVTLGPGRVWTDTGPSATGPLRMVFGAKADLPAAIALLRAPLFQPGGRARDAFEAAAAEARTAAQGADGAGGGVLMAPGAVAGRIAVTVDLALPLRRGGPPLPTGRRPDFTIAGTIRDATSTVLLPGRTIQAAQLDLRADQLAVTIGGAADVDGLPVDIAYSRALMAQPATPARPVPRGGQAPPSASGQVAPPGRGRLVAAFPLRPEDMAAAGLPLPAGALRGAGRGRVQIDFAVDGPPALTLDADLAGLAVALPGIGVRKPAGAPGRITAEGWLGPAPGLAAATLDLPGTAVRLRLPDGLAGGVRLDRLALGGWLDARGRFDPAGDGAPARLVLTAGQADLRAMPRGGGGSGPRMSMVLALDRVTLADGIALTGLRGALSPDLHGTLDAQVNGAAPVTLRLAPGGAATARGPALHLTAADGGAVLRAAGLARGVRAGALDLRLVPEVAQGRYRGQLRLAGLTLPPGGAAALRSGAAGGSRGDATDPAAGDGMSFDDVRAEFTLDPDRIDLHSASATGASLGLAVDGRVNLRDRTLALQGVASPLYFLNRMGAFMTRRGEGLIGLHFTLTGPMDAPDLNANPLSVLTPGPLREMFRMRPDAATPPEDTE